MKCVRCGRDFPTDIPERNVKTYIGSVVYTCPYCNKAYNFSTRVKVDVSPINDCWIVTNCQDDWGRNIVKDIDYESDKNAI